jgi:Flp pilus assembly CpaE family ATPase
MILRLSITAFVINEETKSAIYKIKNERHFARCQIIVHDGGIDNGIESLSANETPNLIIIEAEETGGLLIEKLEALANVTDSNSKILLIGYENDIQLYRNLMDMGISEYLCGTVSAPQLEASINQLFTDPGSIELGRVIACIGARGGTGSSTIAANLADALSQEHSETAILELSAKDFEGSIKSLPTLSIPFEPEVYMSAMNNGKSLIENNNRTKSAKLLEELSTIVSGRVSTLKQNQSFFAELPTYLNTQYLREKLEDANLPFKLFKSDK